MIQNNKLHLLCAMLRYQWFHFLSTSQINNMIPPDWALK